MSCFSCRLRRNWPINLIISTLRTVESAERLNMKLDYKSCGICLAQARKSDSLGLQTASTQHNNTGIKQRRNSENQIRASSSSLCQVLLIQREAKEQRQVPRRPKWEIWFLMRTSNHCKNLKKGLQNKPLSFHSEIYTKSELILFLQPVGVGSVFTSEALFSTTISSEKWQIISASWVWGFER